jgi:hypothetical protein
MDGTYIINTQNQIIKIPSKESIINETDFFPVKIYGNVTEMTDGKLYYINSSTLKLTLIKTFNFDPHPVIPNLNETYVVQHFCDGIVEIDNKLFALVQNNWKKTFPYIKYIDINNVHNLMNIKYINKNKIIFVDDNGKLILNNGKKNILLDENINCKALSITVSAYDHNKFVIIICSDHKINVRLYNKYKLLQEKTATVNFCVDKIYETAIIDSTGNVYNHNWNDLLGYDNRKNLYMSTSKNIVINKIKFDHPIKEIINDIYYIRYYISHDRSLFNEQSNIIMSDVFGLGISVIKTKAATCVR